MSYAAPVRAVLVMMCIASAGHVGQFDLFGRFAVLIK
jgi:hypothetical protein